MKSEPSDDSLLKVIPVYHSKPEDGALYLLQHPTQVESTWNMDGFITSAKLRPSCHQLELEQMIENNQVYNSSMGQQLALNVDGVHRNHRDDSDNSFPSGLMDKSVLRSEGSVEDIDRYCVGELIPGLGLVLAPLSAMLPLRSALDYLDQADSRVKKEKKAEEEAEEGTRSEDATRAVTVRFERPENDRMRNARERSFLHHQRKIMEEPWVKLQYSGFGDSYGEHMRQLTFESVEGEKINPFHLPPSHFLSLLAPPSSCSTSVAALTDANPLDLPQSALYALTLEKQIEKIMRKVGVARHSEILEFLEPEARRGDAALIEKIQVSATLVQGCWVLKSDLLYPTAALTTTTTPSAPHGTTHSYITTRRSAGRTSGRHNTPAGTPHKAMVDAREYALYLLSSQGWLELDKLQQMTPVPGTDMLAMLGAIARPQLAQGNNKSSGRWVFLLDRDDHFIEQHREVTQRYAMKWEYQFRTRIAPR